ncbi:MAG: GNAT family N-acetyltransferase [Pseudomonadota bacterium]
MSEFDRMERPGAALHYFAEGPSWDGAPSVALGSLVFESAEAGAALLGEALDRARGRAVLAPMEGDTWHAYRTVIESDGSKPFLLEPTCGEQDRAALEAAGFEQVARYASAAMPLDPPQAAPAPLDGIALAHWDGDNAQPLLERVFELAGASFADKQFYKPITREAFLAMYLPLLPMLDPRLVFIAREAWEIVGFLLGYRDPADPRRAVLKTYAGSRRGIGHAMADSFHTAAREAGCETVIHALMHEDNVSLTRSAQHGARIFRRYALYGHRG